MYFCSSSIRSIKGTSFYSSQEQQQRQQHQEQQKQQHEQQQHTKQQEQDSAAGTRTQVTMQPHTNQEETATEGTQARPLSTSSRQQQSPDKFPQLSDTVLKAEMC
jgi:hypothetical protein